MEVAAQLAGNEHPATRSDRRDISAAIGDSGAANIARADLILALVLSKFFLGILQCVHIERVALAQGTIVRVNEKCHFHVDNQFYMSCPYYAKNG